MAWIEQRRRFAVYTRLDGLKAKGPSYAARPTPSCSSGEPYQDTQLFDQVAGGGPQPSRCRDRR